MTVEGCDNLISSIWLSFYSGHLTPYSLRLLLLLLSLSHFVSSGEASTGLSRDPGGRYFGPSYRVVSKVPGRVVGRYGVVTLSPGRGARRGGGISSVSRYPSGTCAIVKCFSTNYRYCIQYGSSAGVLYLCTPNLALSSGSLQSFETRRFGGVCGGGLGCSAKTEWIWPLFLPCSSQRSVCREGVYPVAVLFRRST